MIPTSESCLACSCDTADHCPARVSDCGYDCWNLLNCAGLYGCLGAEDDVGCALTFCSEFLGGNFNQALLVKDCVSPCTASCGHEPPVNPATPRDAGMPTPPDDAGQDMVDGGTAVHDAGVEPQDAGTDVQDAGTEAQDAGVIDQDAGVIDQDAGASDA